MKATEHISSLITSGCNLACPWFLKLCVALMWILQILALSYCPVKTTEISWQTQNFLLILDIGTKPFLWMVHVSRIQLSPQLRQKHRPALFKSVLNPDFFPLNLVFQSMWSKRGMLALQLFLCGACILSFGFKKMLKCLELFAACAV